MEFNSSDHGPEPIRAHVRRRFLIRGRVQGVGYRAWTRSKAAAFGLVGFVRNRVDGSVEAVAEGPFEVLALFEEACRRGPALSHVSSIEVSDEPLVGGFGFEIVR